MTSIVEDPTRPWPTAVQKKTRYLVSGQKSRLCVNHFFFFLFVLAFGFNFLGFTSVSILAESDRQEPPDN